MCGGRAFKREERRDTQTDEVVVGRADRERKGRSDRNGAAGNGRAVHVGSKEDVGGLSPPTDAVYGLAGLYVPASASCDGACRRAPPQPTGRGGRASEKGLRRLWGVGSHGGRMNLILDDIVRLVRRGVEVRIW